MAPTSTSLFSTRLLPQRGSKDILGHDQTPNMDSTREKVFRHKPLSPGRNIRVLALQPSRDFNSDIQCELFEASLDNARGKYEALSYVWGSTERDLRVSCNSQPHYVTQNCLLALRYLRKKSKTRYLWVDAICIDQLSNDERGHQVELMGHVYHYASNVIIWLGEAQPETKRAFRHAHNYYHLQKKVKKAKSLLDIVFKYRKFPPELLRLSHHIWFKRVWTFQELIMAPRATIRCGYWSLPWKAFVDRVRDDRLLVKEEKKNLLPNVLAPDIARDFWQLEAIHRSGDSHVTTIDEENRNDFESSNPTLAPQSVWLTIFEYLWEGTKERSCSEPLDRIYGLYGLLRNLGFTLPKPDYYKTRPQIAQELTISIIEASRSLLLLYCFLEQPLDSGGSSWVLDWEKMGNNFARHWGIQRGNHMIFRQNFRPVFENCHLEIEGILCGTLHLFGQPAPKWPKSNDPEIDIQTGFLVLRWLQGILTLTNAFEDYPNGQPAWEAFFMAYINGYYPYSPYESSRKHLERMTQFLLQFGMVSAKLPRHTNLLSQRSRQKQIHTLDDVQLYAYIRDDATVQRFTEELLRTARHCSEGIPFRTSKGWIGVSMCPFEPSDLLALLHGSSVPAILRPVGEHYRLVGFTSVQGIPDQAWPINGDEKGVQRIVLI